MNARTGDAMPESVDLPKQPFRPTPGSKLANSPHADAVTVMLLMRKGYASILRYLDNQKFHVDILTLKEYETNFVSKLAQDVRDVLVKKAQEDENGKQQQLINRAVHARLSRVESLMVLIAKAEDQATQIEEKGNPTSFDREFHGRCLDRIRYYRDQLEKARLESEVELERAKAIEAVANVGLEYLKDNPTLAEEFINHVTAIRDHRDRATDD